MSGFSSPPSSNPNPNSSRLGKRKCNPGKTISIFFFAQFKYFHKQFRVFFFTYTGQICKDSEAEVIELSPTSLTATNHFVCEICNKGFLRDQNLQLHRRGHNLPSTLKQRNKNEVVKNKVYICPEKSCANHDPSRALANLHAIKKHYSRKHGEKIWNCETCPRKYAVQSDWKAHIKICSNREMEENSREASLPMNAGGSGGGGNGGELLQDIVGGVLDNNIDGGGGGGGNSGGLLQDIVGGGGNGGGLLQDIVGGVLDNNDISGAKPTSPLLLDSPPKMIYDEPRWSWYFD
ncbi:putative transcription factor C2H2 family [Helianthus annuus]|nr:putative transcription factor C2H2 family [Helianthus annuus]